MVIHNVYGTTSHEDAEGRVIDLYHSLPSRACALSMMRVRPQASTQGVQHIGTGVASFPPTARRAAAGKGILPIWQCFTYLTAGSEQVFAIASLPVAPLFADQFSVPWDTVMLQIKDFSTVSLARKNALSSCHKYCACPIMMDTIRGRCFYQLFVFQPPF